MTSSGVLAFHFVYRDISCYLSFENMIVRIVFLTLCQYHIYMYRAFCAAEDKWYLQS